MQQTMRRLPNIETVRSYVNQTLCAHENLEVGCFPLSERELMRGGKQCGVHFCLHGPRMLRLAAIWEIETNTILFYGSRGERFHKTQMAVDSATSAMAA